jgi:hypothetical protein
MTRHTPAIDDTLLALAGFVVIVVVVLALTARSGRQWQRKLDDILLPIGFIRCATDADKAPLAQRLGIVKPRHRRRLGLDGAGGALVVAAPAVDPGRRHRPCNSRAYHKIENRSSAEALIDTVHVRRGSVVRNDPRLVDV